MLDDGGGSGGVVVGRPASRAWASSAESTSKEAEVGPRRSGCRGRKNTTSSGATWACEGNAWSPRFMRNALSSATVPARRKKPSSTRVAASSPRRSLAAMRSPVATASVAAAASQPFALAGRSPSRDRPAAACICSIRDKPLAFDAATRSSSSPITAPSSAVAVATCDDAAVSARLVARPGRAAAARWASRRAPSRSTSVDVNAFRRSTRSDGDRSLRSVPSDDEPPSDRRRRARDRGGGGPAPSSTSRRASDGAVG